MGKGDEGMRALRPTAIVLALVLGLSAAAAGQHRLADETDRQAFRAWFVFIADARFYYEAPDVVDCAALVRHAWREALRPHTPEWRRRTGLPAMPGHPDVRRPPLAADESWPLFRVSDNPRAPFREFADARTIVRLNSRPVSRDIAAARPGDLLYFQQAGGRYPDHLMIFVGPSLFDGTAGDWGVYHTGPDGGDAGEMRKVRLADLLRHPAPRWRPVRDNPQFVGVFRPALL